MRGNREAPLRPKKKAADADAGGLGLYRIR